MQSELAGSEVGVASRDYAGVGSGPLFLYRTNCDHTDTSIGECRLLTFPTAGSRCNHFADLSLRCLGEYDRHRPT